MLHLLLICNAGLSSILVQKGFLFGNPLVYHYYVSNPVNSHHYCSKSGSFPVITATPKAQGQGAFVNETLVLK